ncbi:hypothetical protein ACIF70_16680 [Actinacidiphila glaucinigra]|uniref:hypothetical protein n=1 Tax=Actinacidiphila glaucinigra TaxID=235986 RepID=UPI0037C6076A
MELTIYNEKREGLAAAAFSWLTEGIGKSADNGELRKLQQGLRVSKIGFSRMRDSLPARHRQGFWGSLSVSPRGTFDVVYNPYVRDALPWLMRCLNETPESASAQIGEFTEGGDVGNSTIRLSASFDDSLPSYVKLAYHIDEALLTNPATAHAEHARLFTTINWACQRFNVVFGHFSYAHSGGRTELERYLRGPARVPEHNTPHWRERLRGYSWLMVVSEDIARRIGGTDALNESGAFCSVSALPNGSLLLQATSLFHEYRNGRVEAVHHTMREVLIDGEFRQPASVPGQPSTHMVIFAV